MVDGGCQQKGDQEVASRTNLCGCERWPPVTAATHPALVSIVILTVQTFAQTKSNREEEVALRFELFLQKSVRAK